MDFSIIIYTAFTIVIQGSTLATTKNVSCGTRPWESIESYGNSSKYLRKNRTKRIVGGIDADFGEWPWQVSLGTKLTGKILFSLQLCYVNRRTLISRETLSKI